MKFFQFLKWFFNHESKNPWIWTGIFLAVLTLTIIVNITGDIIPEFWIAYVIEVLFFGGYFLAQWYNYKKMKEAEDKRQQLND